MAKSTGIFKNVNGNTVELTASQVKNYVMKINKWSSEQYQKEYDILRNKIRNYEMYQQRRGVQTEKQSVAAFLFKEAKAKAIHGKDYSPSIQSVYIKGFSSASTGKKPTARQLEKHDLKQAAYVNERFKGLINANAGAAKLAQAIKNPVKLEKALVEYANKLHAKMDFEKKSQSESPIPYGETYGSDIDISAEVFSGYFD